MKAMVFERSGRPLTLSEVEIPRPGDDQVLIRVSACAVCRTDLHIVDGELTDAKLPLIPGHQIVGVVVGRGEAVDRFAPGDRVGVPWLGWTDDVCKFCRSDRENLCDHARFTGYQIDGGFAEYAVADARYCFAIPPLYGDIEAAPLLCGGVIGYRALRLAGPGQRLGLYGFGAAAHILVQVAKHQGRDIYAFTRPGDAAGERFAREMGAVWSGGSLSMPPSKLDAALIFAPVGALVPAALRALDRGGTVVCAGIHMSDIPSFPYADLWEERSIRSVANLTRRDAEEFLELAPRVPVQTRAVVYPLDSANEALDDLRSGRIEGAAVLVPRTGAAASMAPAAH
jgi:alcohol dehydrogenase, propanol-preferring